MFPLSELLSALSIYALSYLWLSSLCVYGLMLWVLCRQKWQVR